MAQFANETDEPADRSDAPSGQHAQPTLEVGHAREAAGENGRDRRGHVEGFANRQKAQAGVISLLERLLRIGPRARAS